MTGRTILIVEDHTMIAEVIASILASAGYLSIQARSLAAARAHLAARTFDLWLCDRHLPDGDSSALLAERDQDGRHRGTPALALTAELTASDRSELLAAGFVDALAKPCAPERLREAVQSALARRQPSGVPVSIPATLVAATDARVLDDDLALPICGNDRATLSAMRSLMAGELPKLRERLQQLHESDDRPAIGAELHQLAASAAWCGASELALRGGDLRVAIDRRGAIARQFAALDDAIVRLTQALQSKA